MKLIGAQNTIGKIKPRGHSRLKKDKKPKKSNIQIYLEKKDPYPEKIKSEFKGVLKRAIKELSAGIIKSKASEEYLEKLKRDEIIAKLELRISKMETYRRVYFIRREQIEGPAMDMNSDSDDLGFERKEKTSTIKEEPSLQRSETFGVHENGDAKNDEGGLE